MSELRRPEWLSRSLPARAIGHTLDARMQQRDSEPTVPEAYRVHPDEEVELRSAVDDVRGGRGITLSPEELEQWVTTGEVPDSVKRRFEALKRAE